MKLIPLAEKIVSGLLDVEPSIEKYYESNFEIDDDEIKKKMNILFEATPSEAFILLFGKPDKKDLQEEAWNYIIKDCREQGMVERVLEKFSVIDMTGRPFVGLTGTSHVEYVYKKLKEKEKDIGRQVRTENWLIE
jgi:hypothetical protein